MTRQECEELLRQWDLVSCDLYPGRSCRVVRVEPDGYVVLCDRNTLAELPDYAHPVQVHRMR